MAYVITYKMIRPELRRHARVFRLLMPRYTERMFRLSKGFLSAVERRVDTPLSDMVFKNVHIPRRDGSGDIRLCVYAPMAYRIEPEHEPLPGVLWIHGGGYGLGIPEIDEGFIRGFIETRRCVVVAPDYRLSVEAPYPAALEDCYEALKWLAGNAAMLGVGPDQIIVGGESAGGGLTAALCIYARDRGEVPIAFQMPLYPMLDDRPYPSSTGNDAPVWDTKASEMAWKLYLGEGFRSDGLSPYAAPGRLEDFAGLPPAFTFVGDIEPFHDETVEYFGHLREAGVAAHCHVFEGCFHAFDMLCSRTTVAKEARRLLAEAFADAVDRSSAPLSRQPR